MSKKSKILIVILVFLGVLVVWQVVTMLFAPASNKTTSGTDTFSISDSLECNYKDANGRVAQAYVKNGQIRANIQDADPKRSGSFITKDNAMYYWNSGGGVIIDFNKKGTNGISQKEQLMAAFEQYKQYCKRAVVSDSHFVLPRDVTFKDLNQVVQEHNSYGQPQQ